MKVRGIDHLRLAVVDPVVSSRFYADHLGLEVFFLDLPRRVFLRAGEDLLTLARGEPGSARDAVHLGFAALSAEELRSWRERLESRGVRIVAEQEAPEGSSVYLRDPDDYLIELYYLATTTNLATTTDLTNTNTTGRTKGG